MKTKLYSLLIALATLLVGCGSDDYVASFTDLQLVRLTPTSGYAGDIITILGRNFSTDYDGNTVTINGQTAKILDYAKDELSVILPTNPAGNYSITVNNSLDEIEGLTITYYDVPDVEYTVSTVAGSTGSYGNVDGVGTNALFRNIEGLYYAPDGNIWIMQRTADAHAIRVMSPSNYSVTTLSSSTLFNYPWQGCFDANDDFYVANKAGNNLLKATTAGEVSLVSVSGMTLSNPMGVAFDSSNAMYVTSRSNNIIYKVENGTTLTATYNVTDYVTTNSIEPILIDNNDNVFVGAYGIYQLNTSDGSFTRIAGTGEATTSSEYTTGQEGNPLTATIGSVAAMCLASDGAIYFTDRTNYVVCKLSPDASGDFSKGTVTLLAGSPCSVGYVDGSALQAQFTYPEGIVVSDDCKDIYVGEPTKFTIRRLRAK